MHRESTVDTGWCVAGVKLQSRFLLGSASYPSPQALRDSIGASGTQVVTVGLKRMLAAQDSDGFVAVLRETLAACRAHVLPNTAGCYSAREAIGMAHMARELYQTPWIKLEVIGEAHTLQPDPVELVEAARVLVREGFVVWPYCTDDLLTCRRLLDAGCEVLMPWGAPIGSGQGLLNPFALRTLRECLPNATLIVDAGIGTPSHAAQAMEMGFDAVLLCSAVSRSHDPVEMARAFALAIEAGRGAWRAGAIAKHDRAIPSTPTGAKSRTPQACV